MNCSTGLCSPPLGKEELPTECTEGHGMKRQGGVLIMFSADRGTMRYGTGLCSPPLAKGRGRGGVPVVGGAVGLQRLNPAPPPRPSPLARGRGPGNPVVAAFKCHLPRTLAARLRRSRSRHKLLIPQDMKSQAGAWRSEEDRSGSYKEYFRTLTMRFLSILCFTWTRTPTDNHQGEYRGHYPDSASV